MLSYKRNRPFFNVLKQGILLLSILVSCRLLFSGTSAGYKFSVGKESRLWLEGDSTMHKYESQASVILLSAEGDIERGLLKQKEADYLKSLVLSPGLSRFLLDIPVKELKTKTPGLASAIHDTLKYKKAPSILFHMSDYKAEPVKDKGNSFRVKASGILTVSGQEKEISLDLEVETTEKVIRIRGEKEILMTDFGIKPPVMMFGAIKTDNKVVIKWDLYLIVQFSEAQ